jgi:putative chitinase
VIESRLLSHLSSRLTVDEAQDVADALNAGVEQHGGLRTNRAIAAFCGQCAHESALFTVMQENLRYRGSVLLKMFPHTPRRQWGFISLADADDTVAGGPRSIANRIYGTRMGNRPGTDDGYDFRGSGYIQLTGREAFQRYSMASGQFVDDEPDLVRELPHAGMSAVWVFSGWKKLDSFAESWDIKTISKMINGKDPAYGLAERIELSNKALDWLGDD